ncbi:glycosyltransferase [Burkholderia sp. S171]|uniref:glycosyltransferase n=1 Tax=Burkholderia sp. S171 TaxID=1641860 RepID=UPI00131D3C05|nr:glycosyltransferase [Burkholderia sp. S171]
MNAMSIAHISGRAASHLQIRRWRYLLRDCPLFVASWYVDRYADVATARIDPLSHYLARGWRESRQPGPEFDGVYYLSRYPDVASLGIPPLVHYWLNGRSEGRHPNPCMDLAWIESAGSQRPVSASANIPEGRVQDGRSSPEPLISVIIPTYNRERLLPGVLDAWRELDRATRIPYEIIFSDDGSEDGSVALLEAVHDLPIRVLRNAHGGASPARNAAIRAATGKRLLIIGDDIFPHPELLNVHWELGQKLGPMAATLGVVDWHPDLKVNHLMDHITEIGNEQFSYNRLEDGAFVDFRHFYTCNICVDREILNQQATLFDHRFDKYGFEDIELGYRLALQGLRLYYTRQAKGDHYHPYVIENFCRRQVSAGEMAVLFRGFHPGIGAIVGVDGPERQYKKHGMPSPVSDALWQSRLQQLIDHANSYEHLFERAGRQARSVLGQCLSQLYAPLFRAMYEYGVLQRLTGSKGVLSLAMKMHFGPQWNDYWKACSADGAESVSLSAEQLTELIEALVTHPTEFGSPAVEQVYRELVALRSVSAAGSPHASKALRWRNRVSVGLYLLRRDPLDFVVQVRKMVHRRAAQRQTMPPETRRVSEEVTRSSQIGLILETSSADNDASVAVFRDVFGADARVFARTETNELREVNFDGTQDALIYSIDHARCGYFYWPESASDIPGRDALFDAWVAVAENNLDAAVMSYGFDSPASIRVGALRNHLVFSERIAQCVFDNQLGSAVVRGKVVRVQEGPSRPVPEPRTATELFGQPMAVDGDRGFFASETGEHVARRHTTPRYAKVEKRRPVVFVFPVFVAVGGVERNTVEIMRQLNDRYDFVVVTMERLRQEQGSLGRQFQEVGARLVQMSESVMHEHYLRVLLRLKSSLHPDLVWICNGSPWLGDNAANLRALFADVPIVDQQVYDVDQGWINRYAEPGITSFDRFIAINEKIFKRFTGDLKRDSSVVDLIYSAVDTSRIEAFKSRPVDASGLREKFGLPENKALFGFIGRLTSQKRPVDFLRLAHARREFTDEVFVLVGDGELALDADAFIRDRRMTNVIRIPYVQNTLELDAVLDGLIITSAYEGLPIAMIEALNLAVPVFATDTGDIGIVLDEFNGGVVYPVDAVEADVASRFARWLGTRESFKASLKQKEAAVLRRFSSREIALQYVDCFDKAMLAYQPEAVAETHP